MAKNATTSSGLMRRSRIWPCWLVAAVTAALVLSQLPVVAMGRSLARQKAAETSESQPRDEEGKTATEAVAHSRGRHRAAVRRHSTPPLAWLPIASVAGVAYAASPLVPPASAPPQSDLARRNGLGGPLRC